MTTVPEHVELLNVVETATKGRPVAVPEHDEPLSVFRTAVGESLENSPRAGRDHGNSRESGQKVFGAVLERTEAFNVSHLYF